MPTAPPIQSFFAAKGGQGTTVVATTVAVAHARAGHRTLLIDAADRHDTYAVLGLPEPYVFDAFETAVAAPGLEVRSVDPGADLGDLDGYDVVVIDAGIHRPTIGAATLVTRTCYLALRRGADVDPAPDNVVVITESHRALSGADAAAVLDMEIVAVEADTSVARGVDSGLLMVRPAASLRRLTDAFVPVESAVA
jgi:hypothetical protein